MKKINGKTWFELGELPNSGREAWLAKSKFVKYEYEATKWNGKEWAYTEYHSRLRYCNAIVYKMGYWYFLKSYDTIVASVDGTSVTVFVYGRFTNTTWQHIRKFTEDYANRNANTIYILGEDWY